MLKRLLIMALAILPMLAHGQLLTGQWQTHSTFVSASGNAQNVIDAGGPIYFLSSNFLYRFDRTTKEVTHLNTNNVLSDPSTIQMLAFNYDSNYLMVIYQNTNIDVIKSDGRVVNMPGIYNAVMRGTKAINSVTFAGERAYIATTYGMAVMEPAGNGFKFVENRLYDQNLYSVARIGNWRVATVAGDQGIYYAPESDKLESFDAFTRTLVGEEGFPASSNTTIFPINDTRFFIGSTSLLSRIELTEEEGGTLAFTGTQLYAQRPDNVQRYPNGFVINCYANSRTYTTDANGETPKQLGTGKFMRTLYPTNPDGDSKNQPWVLGASGLYKNGTTDYYVPNGIDFASIPYWAQADPFTGETYIKPSGPNSIASAGATAIDSYDGSKWSKVTPTWMVNGANKSLGNTYEMLFHPTVPGMYFLSCWGNGVFRIQDQAVDFQYTGTNSALKRGTSSNTYHALIAFDSHNNLWGCLGYETGGSGSSVFMLPADKVVAAETTAADWISMAQSSVDTYSGNMQNSKLAIAPQNDVKVYTDGDYSLFLMFWRSDDPSDTHPESRTYTSLRDQTGGNIGKITYVRELKPDNEGNIWMGFTEGLVYFNAEDAFSNDFRVTRPVINGQPLLAGTQVNGFDFDANNCKWIGTNADGVYKVNADNTEILQHFTTSNSPLPTNQIIKVGCNRATGSVWITTPLGVMEYKDGTIISSDDYSNVTIYPSLIKPDFTGLVTISGLMNQSNVVFKNRNGQVVGQTVSTGGTAIWDCCDATGNRLPTGVYTVHASQDDATNADVVGRINILK